MRECGAGQPGAPAAHGDSPAYGARPARPVRHGRVVPQPVPAIELARHLTGIEDAPRNGGRHTVAPLCAARLRRTGYSRERYLSRYNLDRVGQGIRHQPYTSTRCQAPGSGPDESLGSGQRAGGSRAVLCQRRILLHHRHCSAGRWWLRRRLKPTVSRGNPHFASALRRDYPPYPAQRRSVQLRTRAPVPRLP